jgi:hypothetical protein
MSPRKISKPYDMPLLGFNNGGKKRKEEVLMGVSVSHSGIYLKLAYFPVKIGLIGGVGGVPNKFYLMES